MDHVLGLKCTICGAEYAPDEVEYVCPKHGNEGILDVVYDYGRIAAQVDPPTLSASQDRSIWRYLPLLPVDPGVAREIVPGTTLASVGWTPLLPAPRLADALGQRHVWVKDDSRQPTASFKDRASAIAVVKALERNATALATASTGNAAAALAGLCAAVAQPSVIFVPRTAPEAKVAQLLAYGAQVLLVDGSYDQAFELCLQAAPRFGWYNRNTGYNPYMSEGKKTAAYEICEQLAASVGTPDRAPLQAPDVLFVPVGDGCIIGGLHKGLRDLVKLGWIAKMPRLIGVQAAGSSPLVTTWKEQCRGVRLKARDVTQIALDMAPVDAHTLADSISAGLPRDRIKALRAVVETSGAYLRVTDEQILAAIPALAQGCGVFAEPAAAAAYAGLVQAVQDKLVAPDDRIVVLCTGSGLKDARAAIQSVAQPPVIAPELAAVERALEM